jgi:23S rRNA U2552 (ribose-2'-O)-methylase RlmE/FtsJ
MVIVPPALQPGIFRRKGKQKNKTERTVLLLRDQTFFPSPSLSAAMTTTHQESVGERLLRLAGYGGQGGLGKHASGIVQPIAVANSTHPPAHVRLGIGFAPKDEPPVIKARVACTAEWLTHASVDDSHQDTQLPLVDATLWAKLLDSKSQLDRVDGKCLIRARQRSNPYEAIKTEGYQNRAAVKLAELDAVCGGILTQPILARAADEGRVSHVLDLCGGPGGFTEFLATQLGWRCRFHGATLRSSNDFAVSRFNASATTHTFQAYYGQDGTGDLLHTPNLRHIYQRIQGATHHHGVHLVLADGGFDVSGRENHQERLSQRLLHCQLSLGLASLSPGGHLVGGTLVVTRFPLPPASQLSAARAALKPKGDNARQRNE